MFSPGNIWWSEYFSLRDILNYHLQAHLCSGLIYTHLSHVNLDIIWWFNPIVTQSRGLTVNIPMSHYQMQKFSNNCSPRIEENFIKPYFYQLCILMMLKFKAIYWESPCIEETFIKPYFYKLCFFNDVKIQGNILRSKKRPLSNCKIMLHIHV